MKFLVRLCLCLSMVPFVMGGCECTAEPEPDSNDIRIRAPGTKIDIDLPEKRD